LNGVSASPVRIGVVGAGFWGPNLIRNFHELLEAELRWVCDLDPEALEKVARRWPGVGLTTTMDDVLADPSIDAIAVATPISTHYELARAALDAGKHVFVEKPLASSSELAETLVTVAGRRGLTLMPGHTFVYSPSVTLVDELIKGGELGEIYFVSMSRLNLGIHQPDVSVVWDLAPHDFAMLRLWLDEMPETVSAMSRGCIMPGTPDVAFVHAGFPSGAVANIELAWLAPTKLRRTVVVGSRRMVVYDDTSPEPVRIFDSQVTRVEPQTFGEFQLSYRTGAVTAPPPQPVEPLYLELADFCRSVREGTPPRASAETGLEVVRIVEAVERSLAKGGRPVSVSAVAGAGAVA
jgi:predicted dehydrogenase